MALYLRAAVLTAVHNDLKAKQRRQRNIIITGFKTTGDDKTTVSELLLYNLGVQVDIVSTRRLGQYHAGRMQLLQVVLSDASQAAIVLGLAKSLRHSTDEFVRTKVYINPDLTVAEAKAAFDTRCAARSRRSENEMDVRSGGQVDQQRNRPAQSQDSETGCRPSTSGFVASNAAAGTVMLMEG